MFNSKQFYFVVISHLTLSISAIDSVKYDHISSCEVNGQFWDGEARANFICDKLNNENEIFNDDPLYIANYLKIRIGLVRFENCQFREMHRKFGVDFINLRTFNISDVGLEVLKNNTFKGVQKLSSLIASNNRLTVIPPYAFDDAKRLDRIDLSNNAIQKLSALSFAGAISVTTMNLSRNQLTHEDIEMLSLPNLRVLDLSYNPIGKLLASTFSNHSALTHLLLRRTNISSIEMKTFLHLEDLISLDLSGNLLTRLNINLFHPTAASNLRSLSLHDNKLSELHCVQNFTLTEFMFLDVNNNNFNCSYLKEFMDFVHWEQFSHEYIRFKSNDSIINGVACKNISGENESSALKNKQFQVEFCPAIDDSHPDKSANGFPYLTTILVVVFVGICISVIAGVRAYRRRGFHFNSTDLSWMHSTSTIQITIE